LLQAAISSTTAHSPRRDFNRDPPYPEGKSMRRIFFVLCLAILQSVAYANNLVVKPTTTLAQQTSNNTSAADTFKAQVNGNIAAGNVSTHAISRLRMGSSLFVLSIVIRGRLSSTM